MNKNNVELLNKYQSSRPSELPRKRSFVMGMHKGGSTMLHNFIEIITKSEKVASIDVGGAFFNAGIGDADYSYDDSLAFNFDDPFIYYGFRYCPAFFIKNREKLYNDKIVILVRDPRDCVVSAYYSFLNSHVLPVQEGSAAENILQERQLYDGVSVDEYCLKEIYRFVDELVGLTYFLNENSFVRRYEDIIFNKKHFFTQLIKYLDLNISTQTFDKALKFVDVKPVKEDSSKHIRRVSPGNYKEKLKKDTINKINEKYRDILEIWNYEID